MAVTECRGRSDIADCLRCWSRAEEIPSEVEQHGLERVDLIAFPGLLLQFLDLGALFLIYLEKR